MRLNAWRAPGGTWRIRWCAWTFPHRQAFLAPSATRRLWTSPLGFRGRVWGKLESFNPGGSAKDRTARAMVAAATARGLLHPVEDPDPETGDWLTARRNLVAELKRELGAVNLDQYSNRAAFDAHDQGTMREIVQQLGHAPELLAVAVSTTGTVGGCLRHIREHGYGTKVVAVDAEGSVLFGGDRGERILPGYGAGVVTELSKEVAPDRVVRVSAADAVRSARGLARSTGFVPGASGGAVAAAVAGLIDEGAADEIVGVFHDDGRAYLDTVYNDEWVEAHIGGLE